MHALAPLGLVLGLALSAAPTVDSPSTYYLACGGSGTGAGTETSPWTALSQANGHPFRTGDRLLIKDGTTCTGTLTPAGSGTASAPITIDRYGSGAAPVLDGNGSGAAVELHDVQGWDVRDLTITDPASARGNEKGIFVLLDDNFSGTATHYAFTNLTIHDVDGAPADVRGNGNGGIILRNTHADGRTHFADVHISDNTFTEVSGLGVQTWNVNCTRNNSWGNECGGTYAPSTGVVVSHNNFTDIGTGAIVPFTTTGALVDHNTVTGFNVVPGGIAAAFWISNGDDATFEYNSATGGVIPQPVPSNYDSMAYDIDQDTRNVVFQYNLSHDNGGGGFMFCLNSTNGTFRYNISIADGTKSLKGCAGTLTNARFYDNDIVVNPSGRNQTVQIIGLGSQAGAIRMTDNIVRVFGGNITWTGYPNVAVDHNLIDGITAPSGATNTVTGSPDFVNGDITSASDKKLLTGSPALGAGVLIAGNGGRDYFGNPVSATAAPNIGAYDGPGIAP